MAYDLRAFGVNMRGHEGHLRHCIGDKKGGTTKLKQSWEISGKVKLLFQLLPSLPFEEQIGFLSGFLPK